MKKFNVGDKVQVVRMDISDVGYDRNCCFQNNYLGKTGTVESIQATDSKDEFILGVSFDDTFILNEHFAVNSKWVELMKRPYNGKVICVEANDNSLFKLGKIYKVVEGRLYDESKDPWSVRVYSIEDINHLVNSPVDAGVKFIEFKGYADTGKDKNE